MTAPVPSCSRPASTQRWATSSAAPGAKSTDETATSASTPSSSSSNAATTVGSAPSSARQGWLRSARARIFDHFDGPAWTRGGWRRQMSRPLLADLVKLWTPKDLRCASQGMVPGQTVLSVLGCGCRSLSLSRIHWRPSAGHGSSCACTLMLFLIPLAMRSSSNIDVRILVCAVMVTC